MHGDAQRAVSAFSHHRGTRSSSSCGRALDMGSPPEEGISGVDTGLKIFFWYGERGVGNEFYIFFFCMEQG